MSNSKKTATNRGRNWVFVVYEDSLPEGEPFKTLDEVKVPYFMVWHDRDADPNGEPKKKHAHILLMFEGNKSTAQMQAFQDAWKCPPPKRVENLRSMARYLCHLDNPEKFQYTYEDVASGYGADYINIINLAEDKYGAVRQMMQFVIDNEIEYYSDLLEYAAANNDMWFRALLDTSRQTMYEYIKSRAYKAKEKAKEIYEFDRVKYPVKHSPENMGEE